MEVFSKEPLHSKTAAYFKLTDTISTKIMTISNNSSYAAYIILLSGVIYLLHKYAGKVNIIVNSPIYNPTLKYDESTNLVSINCKVNDNSTYKEYLLDTKKALSDAIRDMENGINTDLYIEQRVVVLMEDVHNTKTTEYKESDFVFSFKSIDNSIACNLQYDIKLYEKKLIKKMIRFINDFFDVVTNNTNVRLSQLDFSSGKEKQHILIEYRNLDREVFDVEDDNLILLNKGLDPYKHLFFIHDVSGGVEPYIELSSRLDRSFNYWGIKANSLEAYCPMNLEVESIAYEYLKKMKKVNPHGPYNIITWSDGGVIAFEIVRFIEELDERVTFFSLLDSAPPERDMEQRIKVFNLETEKIFLQKLIKDNNIIEDMYKFTELNELYSFTMDYLNNNVGYDFVLSCIPDGIKKIMPDYEKLNIKELVGNFNLIRSIHRAKMAYMPKNKIRTTLNVFVPAQSCIANINEWNTYCQKPIRKHKINGNHTSIITAPDAEELSLELNKLLYKINKDIIR